MKKEVIALLLCCSLFNQIYPSTPPRDISTPSSDKLSPKSTRQLKQQQQKIIDAHPAGRIYYLYKHQMNQEFKGHIKTTELLGQLVDKQQPPHTLLAQVTYQVITNYHPSNLSKIGRIKEITIGPIVSDEDAKSIYCLLISRAKDHLKALNCDKVKGVIYPDYNHPEIEITWDTDRIDEQKTK